MNIFLKELSKQYPEDIILLCCDGAAWHKAGSLCVPDNIELFFIPPYTPEMNPIEQIWKELRKMVRRNQVDNPHRGHAVHLLVQNVTDTRLVIRDQRLHLLAAVQPLDDLYDAEPGFHVQVDKGLDRIVKAARVVRLQYVHQLLHNPLRHKI